MRQAKVSRPIPASAERRSEIVAEIIEIVKKHSVKVFTETLIDHLLVECEEPLTGNRTKNKKHAVRLHKQLMRVKKTLEEAPNELVAFIFEPEKFGPLYMLEREPIAIISRFPGHKPGIVPSDVRGSSLAQERRKHFIEEVDRQIARCGHATAAEIGRPDSREEYPQQRAAIASRAIMMHAGLPLLLSEDSEYCLVAGLFFEAMTGETDRDLRRACTAMARNPLLRAHAKPRNRGRRRRSS